MKGLLAFLVIVNILRLWSRGYVLASVLLLVGLTVWAIITERRKEMA
jgi:hypothetical protein